MRKMPLELPRFSRGGVGRGNGRRVVRTRSSHIELSRNSQSRSSHIELSSNPMMFTPRSSSSPRGFANDRGSSDDDAADDGSGGGDPGMMKDAQKKAPSA